MYKRQGLYVAAPFGIDNIITVDMGGTSFDITMARAGQTNLNRNIDFLRHRIGVPMIHVETLGAGGGSIAHLNAFGMLEVGPQSAGSMPGPACYGLGGEAPTVTDANMVLGYLRPDAVLGGTIRLDRERARAAVQRHVAEPLGLSLARAAHGIGTLVNLNMAHGIRGISIENGYDCLLYTSGFTLELGASLGRGKAQGKDESWTNSHVSAGKVLAMQSGGNTTLREMCIRDRCTTSTRGTWRTATTMARRAACC